MIEDNVLSPDAQARIEALEAAKRVLSGTGLVARAGVDPIDLVNVAGYILTGEDPWAGIVVKEEVKPEYTCGHDCDKEHE